MMCSLPVAANTQCHHLGSLTKHSVCHSRFWMGEVQYWVISCDVFFQFLKGESQALSFYRSKPSFLAAVYLQVVSVFVELYFIPTWLYPQPLPSSLSFSPPPISLSFSLPSLGCLILSILLPQPQPQQGYECRCATPHLVWVKDFIVVKRHSNHGNSYKENTSLRWGLTVSEVRSIIIMTGRMTVCRQAWWWLHLDHKKAGSQIGCHIEGGLSERDLKAHPPHW